LPSFVSLVASDVTLARPATPQQAKPSADEIVAKHLEAMGGLERLKDIQTMKKVAKVTMQGRQTTTTMYFKRPNLSRQELQIDGQTVINAFDGTTPWIINPLTGFKPARHRVRRASRPDPRGLVLRRSARRLQVEGHAHRLRGIGATGRRASAPPPRDLGQPAGPAPLSGCRHLPGVEAGRRRRSAKLEQLSSDYRDVDGVKVAHHLKTVVNGAVQAEMQLESVEFNLPLETALFRMPKG
jgi:hypothetical protein